MATNEELQDSVDELYDLVKSLENRNKEIAEDMSELEVSVHKEIHDVEDQVLSLHKKVYQT